MKLTHALAATLTAGVVALVPSAAHAGSNYHVDPAGDMGKITEDMDEDADPVPAPERVESDVRSIRVTHLPRTVRVAMTYRALNRVGLFKATGLRIVSDKGVREVFVSAGPGNWRGDREVRNGAGKLVGCAGMTHQLDYVNDKVLFVIPRTCLGSPRWVRVAGFSAVVVNTGTTGNPEFTYYVDDARASNHWGKNPALGPRVYR